MAKDNGNAFADNVLRAMDKADEDAMAGISDQDWQAMLITMQQYTMDFIERLGKA